MMKTFRDILRLRHKIACVYIRQMFNVYAHEVLWIDVSMVPLKHLYALSKCVLFIKQVCNLRVGSTVDSKEDA